MNTTIDGHFPAHHPDPTEEKNLTQLRSVVGKEKCDLGIAFDGDADRIGVVDSRGRIVWGDQLLILLGRDLLQRHPGARIIADVKSSQALFEEIAKAGGEALMGRTGHSLIKKMIKDQGALLAGEMSGHIFFADEYYGYDDALYAAVRLIRLLENSDFTLAEMLDQLPRYVNTPEIRIPCSDDKKFQIIEEIRTYLQSEGREFNDIDGVRVKRETGWWLLRASNTQPILVAWCESNSPENLALIQDELNAHLKRCGILH